MGSNDTRAPLPAGPVFLDLRAGAPDRAEELRGSLLCEAPFIAPKFFYGALGSRLFEAICELPEYTLTRAERSIFDRHGREIAAVAGVDRPLVDLGAGDCEKAERLFPLLSPSQYVAIDIAADFLRERLAALALRHPLVSMIGLAQDFTATLELPEPVDPAPRTLFYPGSSIGNFTPDAAVAFLRLVRAACGAGGCLILGADLVRDKRSLDLAYDDPLGVTAAFNLNVLRTVNACIGADFDVADWQHVAFFDPVTARVEMHLEARCDVTVRWEGGRRVFHGGDRIHTENSYKYTLRSLRALLGEAGFAGTRLWTDEGATFAVSAATA